MTVRPICAAILAGSLLAGSFPASATFPDRPSLPPGSGVSRPDPDGRSLHPPPLHIGDPRGPQSANDILGAMGMTSVRGGRCYGHSVCFFYANDEGREVKVLMDMYTGNVIAVTPLE